MSINNYNPYLNMFTFQDDEIQKPDLPNQYYKGFARSQDINVAAAAQRQQDEYLKRLMMDGSDLITDYMYGQQKSAPTKQPNKKLLLLTT